MSQPESEPTLIYDSIDLDIFIKVLRMTFLNPLFAIWTPLLVIQQQYSTTSPPYRFAVLYAFSTFFLAFLSWSNVVWTNKLWQKRNHPRGMISALFSGPSLEWGEQIVVVTGGANGIGRILVETLAVLRVETVVVDRVEYKGDWDDVHSYICDLADPKQVREVIEKIKNEVGHPTILVNNAGVVKGKLLIDLTDEDVKNTFDVNVLAQFALIRGFLPNMIKEGKGHIVTIASIFSLMGSSQLSDYCASKHALLGLHESLSYELKYHYGDPSIRTTLLLPGHVRTTLFDKLKLPSRAVRFLAPTVEPHAIAKAVIAALDTEQSRKIYLPWYGNLIWVINWVLPTWAKDAVVWFSGANYAMGEYGGKGSGEKKED